MIFAMALFDRKYHRLQKWYLNFFAPALAVSEILTFGISDLDKVGQSTILGMANIRIYRSRITYFKLALTVSKILASEIFDLEKVDQGHGV